MQCQILFWLCFVNVLFQGYSHLYVYTQLLNLKAPRKPASENVVCLCRLLNIFANFLNLFLHIV